VIKSQLILNVAAQLRRIRQSDVDKAVDAILDEIVLGLARGDRVEIRGFGSFSVRVREGRIGRNPKTGSTVHVPEKKFAYFRPGHEMRKRLNRGAP